MFHKNSVIISIPNEDDSSDDDFDKMMDQMRSEKRPSESENSPKSRKVPKMKNDDFIRAVNQSDSEPENRLVNSDESDTDEELGDMLKEAETRKETAKNRVEVSDADSDQEVSFFVIKYLIKGSK